MKLRELLKGLSVLSATADLEMEIPNVSYDSRTTRRGDLFVAMRGFASDGHAYIGKAAEAGAAAVLSLAIGALGEVLDYRLCVSLCGGFTMAVCLATIWRGRKYVRAVYERSGE